MREHGPVHPEPEDMRAADADRQRVAAAIERHYLDGRLTAEELDEWLGWALAARTDGDLASLLTDLPPLPKSTHAARVKQQPVRRVSRDLRAQATKYALVMVLLIVLWAATTPTGHFWPIWPMLGWGIAVASQFLRHGGSVTGGFHHPVWWRHR